MMSTTNRNTTNRNTTGNTTNNQTRKLRNNIDIRINRWFFKYNWTTLFTIIMNTPSY